ncbi:hypothetical protein T01_1246 [Trichinella spiralis]|uniref:Uncharacterized protein n=1 Tax=Trichinella spiralis TaxID=6334 RepID=A0A0V0Z0N0_TRISP|nr:hypothetical protein T01_1246 [Trichinella spiralis]
MGWGVRWSSISVQLLHYHSSISRALAMLIAIWITENISCTSSIWVPALHKSTHQPSVEYEHADVSTAD